MSKIGEQLGFLPKSQNCKNLTSQWGFILQIITNETGHTSATQMFWVTTPDLVTDICQINHESVLKFTHQGSYYDEPCSLKVYSS